MDNNIPGYAALLRKQYIFQGLDDAQMAHVVNRLVRQDSPAGHILVEEGSRGASFYIIYAGRVQVTRHSGERVKVLGTLGVGDFFGEESLLFDKPRSVTVRALEPTTVLRLDRESFFVLLNQVPDIRLNLSATSESRYLVRREQFDWLGEDEVIYLISRKHELFLYLSLILPLVLGIASIPVLVWGITGATPFFTRSGTFLGISGMLAAVLWAVWSWLDWGNDYYIVTSQRVVWLERVIILYYSRREAPLTQVLAVNTRSSFWGQLFNYGNVEVRTYTGGILMRKCADPKRFASFVENYQSRAKSEQKETESETIDIEIRRRLGVDDAGETAPSPAIPQKPPVSSRSKPGSLRDRLDTFLKLRYERGDVITYRKHWLVLIAKTWKPGLVGLLLSFAFAYAVYLDWFAARPVLSLLTLSMLYMLLSFFDLLWWGYNYLDWSDDIYQLTTEQVLDIERKPLGDEIKKSAPLDSILSIEHERLGIIQLIFNYGNVIINVGQTQFTFLGVHNPDQVHQDVADRIEARRRSKAETQLIQERQRLGDWFSIYRKNTESLEEGENDTEWDMFPG